MIMRTRFLLILNHINYKYTILEDISFLTVFR